MGALLGTWGENCMTVEYHPKCIEQSTVVNVYTLSRNFHLVSLTAAHYVEPTLSVINSSHTIISNLESESVVPTATACAWRSTANRRLSRRYVTELGFRLTMYFLDNKWIKYQLNITVNIFIYS